ncbi:hypothetical protein FIBSPDRAFT_939533 [Athelia psychrophila]|nr:hypothetical protein FIBSPDRAFT_939533 [Fibularhizoctonia sp. CBS 109695]
MMIVDSGILCTVGILGLLPLCVLIAWWTRTFTTHRFTGNSRAGYAEWGDCRGPVIHFFKSKTATRRPAQYYAHAALGLLIIALAFWQVHTGCRHEYPEWTMGRVPMGGNTLWIVWVVFIPVAYSRDWRWRQSCLIRGVLRRLGSRILGVEVWTGERGVDRVSRS